MRTIEAPGVEINEIDKSQYSPAIAGTAALVVGFANKGEDYTAMQMTSRSAWINYYGEPDNEAERYFYTACMEVINQNGKLYCAKIPYENEARDRYVVKKYTVSTRCNEIKSVYDFITDDPSLVNLLDGNYTRYGYGLSNLPGLTAIDDPEGKTVLSDYALTMMNVEKNTELIQTYNKMRNAKSVAVPIFYRCTDTAEDDNWWYYNQVNAYERLSGLFTPYSHFWQNSKKYVDINNFADLVLSSLDEYLADYMEAGAKTEQYTDLGITTLYYKPEQYVEAFVKSYADVFGESATEFQPYNFNFAKLDSTDVVTNHFQHFIKDNAALFKKIDMTVYKGDVAPELSDAVEVVSSYDQLFEDKEIKAFDTVPYIYADSSERCNLMAYYTAAKNIIDTKNVDISSVGNIISKMKTFVSYKTSDGTLLNKWMCSRYIVSYTYLHEGELQNDNAQVFINKEDTVPEDKIKTELVRIVQEKKGWTIAKSDIKKIIEAKWFNTEDISNAPYLNLSAFFVGSLVQDDELIVDPEREDLGMTQNVLTELINDLEVFIHGRDNTVYTAIKKQFNIGTKVHTEYIAKLFEYYATNVNISGYYDTSALYSAASTIDTLNMTYVPQIKDGTVVVDADGNEVLEATGKNFFEMYGNVVQLSDVSDLLKKKAEQGIPYTIEENIAVLEDEYNKTVTKPLLTDFVNKIKAMPEFAEIEDYLRRTPATYELYRKFNVQKIEDELKYSEIRSCDDTIKDYFKITSNNNVFTLPLTQIDEYKTDEDVVPPNQIYIADMTRSPYVRASDVDEHECIGIIPIVTTAANALVAQSIIENVTKGQSYAAYQPLSSVTTLYYPPSGRQTDISDRKCKPHDEFIINGNANAVLSSLGIFQNNKRVVKEYPYNLSSYCAREIFSDDPDVETVSQELAGYFSTIQYNDAGKLDRDNMYDIGVIVLKAYLDASEGNKISFNAVESFVGSLDRTAVNPNTGVTKFIDTIVNSQSEYINLFSNCYASTATRKEYDEKCDILVVDTQKAGSLGFYEDMVVEDISLAKSIYDGLEKVFDKNQDINEKEIDIFCDAGVSNIAQYIKTVYGTGKGPYDPTSTAAAMFKLKSRNDTLTWRNTIQKYDNFCKNVRKDCMFVADGLRPFCLQGQKKIVRPTKPANTIDANLLPNLKYMTGLNTNYGAGYCDWFQKADDFTGEYFWCPPSIQATGIYIYTDVHAEYWDAPAGLNRGIVAALDVAFSPTIRQAGTIYNNNWNYAINYPQDGIVLEGQKTFQVKPSAFDRVNVRRLFLRLERATYKVARYFVYEGNTAYTRQRLIDTIDPIFADVKLRNGIYDYKIICDESINTPDVIDRNELKVKIGIKPVKTAEFILIDFIALTTGGSFDEM